MLHVVRPPSVIAPRETPTPLSDTLREASRAAMRDRRIADAMVERWYDDFGCSLRFAIEFEW